MSQDIVSSFEKGHQAILSVISQLQPIVHSYAKARPLLQEFSDVLMAHLTRQDQRFFQRLSDHCKSDRESLKMIEFLVYDVQDIKIKYLTFAEKYSGGWAEKGSPAFPKDFMDFKQALVTRIQLEEEYLLPMLMKYA